MVAGCQRILHGYPAGVVGIVMDSFAHFEPVGGVENNVLLFIAQADGNVIDDSAELTADIL